MKYQIVITSPTGEIADTIPVVNGASLALAPGEDVSLLTETGEPAKFDLQVTGGDSLVTFESGEWVKLMNYSFAPAPSPLVGSAAAVEIATAVTAAMDAESTILPTTPQEDEAEEIETGEAEASEDLMVSLQNDAIPVSFGAGGGGGAGGEDSANEVVGAISTDPGFTLIRKSDVSGASFGDVASAQLSTPQNGGNANQQGEDAEPTLLVRETETIRTISIPGFSGPTNAAPVAIDDLAETSESGVVVVPILDNDYDPDGENDFSILVEGIPIVPGGSPVTLPSGATVILTDNGEIEYDPGDEFVSTPAGGTSIDTFTYTIVDEDGASDSATVSVQINGENDLPDAQDDPVEMDDNGGPLTIPVLDNDGDPDGDPLTVSGVIQPTSGATVTINPDGTVTYDPGSIFEGLGEGETAIDTFTYIIDDGNGGTDTATVTVTINGVNDAPVANPDQIPVGEDDTTNIPIIDNDDDPNGDDLCVSHINGVAMSPGDSITLASGAVLTLKPDFSVDYDTSGVFNSLQEGTTDVDTFEYTLCDEHGGSNTSTVTVTVEGKNDAPIAVADQAIVDQNGAVDVDVLENDSDPDIGDTISVIGVTQSQSGGIVSINPNGTVNFDTNGDFNHLAVGETAIVDFTYTIEDSFGETDTAPTASRIVVTGTNDGPNANNDNTTTPGDTPIDIDVLDNDFDPDTSDDLEISGVTQPASGATVSINPDGTVNYDPGTIFEGVNVGDTTTDTFTYSIDDGNGGTDTATVTVTIQGTNLPPEAQDDSVPVTENGLTSIPVLDNDSDPNNDDLTITGVTQPTGGGTVAIENDGTISFNPNGQYDHLAAGETATETFTYTIEDEFGNTDTATVTVNVQGANDAPAAANDIAITTESSAVDIPVLDNDDDPDASDTHVVSITGFPPSGANVTVNPDGTVSYDPDGNFEYLAAGETATEVFQYKIDDQNGGTDFANVTVTIQGENDAPTAIDDDSSTGEDNSVDIDVLANDDEVDTTDVLTITAVSQPPSSGAIVSVNPDGTVKYDPNGQFEFLATGETATDSFTYSIDDGKGGTDNATVTVVVVGTEDLPVAIDDSETTDESSTVSIEVLNNDFDPDSSNQLQVVSLTQPTSGAFVVVDSQGEVDYVPNGSFEHLAEGESATDIFTYTIEDNSGNTDIATVTIVINGENDAPDAVDDTANTNEDSAVDIDLLANDSDIDATDDIVIAGFSQPTSGAIVTQNPDGSVNYDPNGNYEYLANGETALDTFIYTTSDGKGGTASATATVTIFGINDAPSLVDDAESTTESLPVTIDILANDSDPDHSDGQVVTITQPIGGGAATLNPNNTVTFSPNGNFENLAEGESATDIFSYTVDDENGGTDTANVIVTILGENDAPDASDDEASTNEDSPVNIDVLDNDSDVDSTDVLDIQSITQPTSGAVVTENPDGTLRYNPNGNYEYLANGETAIDTFVYATSDGNGGSASATATVTIFGTNDAPEAIDDAATTTESATVNIDALANDLDPDLSDNHTILEVTQPGTGAVVSIRPDNTIDYNPNGNFESLADGETAIDSFTYTIDDGNGGTDIATVNVTIYGENDAPAAANDTDSTDEESTVNLDILANDSDIDDPDSFSVVEFNGNPTFAGVLVDLPSGARISLQLDGTVNYIPNGQYDSLGNGETAIDSFEYTIEDENGATATAIATVTINGLNDAPLAVDDASRTDEDTPINLNITANDSDPEGDELSISEINGLTIQEGVPFDLPSGGILTLQPNGTLTFDPASGYDFVAVGQTGVETFQYSVDDGNGGTATAEVNIIVDGINDPPVAVDDAPFEANEDGPSAFHDITPGTPGQDFDPEGEVSVVGINGTLYNDGDQVILDSGAYVIMNADGNIEYNANDAFHAELDLGESLIETISYTIADEFGATDLATFQVTVIGQNDAPIANDDCSFGNTPGTDVVINPIANDVDIDGFIDPSTLSIGAIDLDPATDGVQTEYVVPGQGTWTVNPDATVTFAPAPELGGNPDPIYYSVADNHGLFGEPAAIEVSYFTADIWFANDLSGSVDPTEYQASLDLMADAAEAVEFGSGTMGNQAAMISWAGEGEQNLDVALTNDKDAFINDVTTDPRDFSGFTDLGGALNFSIDNIIDPANGSRQPNGVAQVLTVLTDVHPDQLFNRDPYDDPRYPQDQIAQIEAAAQRAADLGITLVIVPIQDAASSPEAVAFFESVAATGPGGDPLVYPAGDYNDIDDDTVAGVVEALRLASAPPGHENCLVGTPITVDLNNDGVIEYFPIEDGFRFDIDGDGQNEEMAWVGNDDAILIYDKDQNGEISHRSEFILSDWTKAEDTDLEAVASFFDSNQDGTFNIQDGEFEKFALWSDTNGNSEVDDGEWTTLLDAGVIGFDVEGDGQYSAHAGGDVQVAGNTEFVMGNGETLLAHDAAFHFRNTTESGEMLTNAPENDPIIVATEGGEFIGIEPASTDNSEQHQQILAEPIQTTNSGDFSSANPTLDDETVAATAAAQSA